MDVDTLAAALDAAPFHPLCLNLVDGSTVEVDTPYLSFVQRDALYVARARRDTSLRVDVALIPLSQIASVSS